MGADHAGRELKTRLKERLSGLGYEALDLGMHDSKSVDYPDFGRALAAALKQGKAAGGVLVCGSGSGMSIAANGTGTSASRYYTASRLPVSRAGTTKPMCWRAARA